jgi:hypothetical protein
MELVKFGEIFHPGGNRTKVETLGTLVDGVNQPMIAGLLSTQPEANTTDLNPDSGAIRKSWIIVFSLSELQLPHRLFGSVSRKQESSLLLILQGRKDTGAARDFLPWVFPHRDDLECLGPTARGQPRLSGEAFKGSVFLPF